MDHDPITLESASSKQMCGCGLKATLIPSGECPAKLKGTSEKEVSEWAEKVMEYGHQNQTHYAPSALRYYARYFFNGSDHVHVCSILKNIFTTPYSAEAHSEDVDETVAVNKKVKIQKRVKKDSVSVRASAKKS